ncbi:MAG: DNA adenine methylase [Opitutaceae bacterium]|jgi:hypothetical protein
MTLKAPFTYFGGKSGIAQVVWDHFGDVPNYIEPFAGSMAVLLARPHWPWDGNRSETVNDKDCFLSNFWRAVQQDPEAVAMHCDWPVNEADLVARHAWLRRNRKRHERKIKTDPYYFDAKIAGWWVWGASQWLGSGWCFDDGAKSPEKIPNLGDGGAGVHRRSFGLELQAEDVGVKVPKLGGGEGVHRAGIKSLVAYFEKLAMRLRRVRVCSGEWYRVCGGKSGDAMAHFFACGKTCGIFLDPPYTSAADRTMGVYSNDSGDVGHDAHRWAMAHGDDPRLRIALCGYEGEYDIPDSWECVEWKAVGGYGLIRKGKDRKKSKSRENAMRERVWFSPHCLVQSRLSAFGGHTNRRARVTLPGLDQED